MKRIFLTLASSLSLVVIVAIMAISSTSCSVDDPNFAYPEDALGNESSSDDNNNTIIDPNSNGYVTIAGLSLVVEPKEEGFKDNDEAQAPTISSVTRATETSTRSEASDDYIVEIINETTNKVEYSESYDTVKALTKPITLKAGYYAISAKSCDQIPAMAWENPSYTSESQSFTVGDEKTHEVEELICRLASIKVGVAISADMLEEFKTENLTAEDTELQVVVSYGSSSETFTPTESRSLFFAPVDGCNEITILLKGMYNTAIAGETPVYQYIEWEHTISSVAAGQSREISIKVANYNDGKIEFTFEVQKWTYDDPIGVNIYSSIYNVLQGEAGIYDPDSETTDPGAPTVTLAEGLSADEYTIYSGMMDSSAGSYDPTYIATITPQNNATLQSIELKVYSDNNSFDDAIYDLGYKFDILPLWSDNAASPVSTPYIDYTLGGNNSVVATLKYAAIEMLGNYKGTHRMVVKATDSAGLVSHTDLNILSISVGGPEVTWRGDYDFGTVYPVYTEAEVIDGATNPVIILDISSGLGITAMTVNIDSEILTPEELGSMGLAQQMDLINPGDNEDGLKTLGFPVGDEVLNVRALSFDITEFMPQLAAICPAGNNIQSNFTIAITDGTGTREVTIQVVRE